MKDWPRLRGTAPPRLRWAVLCMLCSMHTLALAEVATQAGGSPTAALSASARLDFNVNNHSFLFFRVGAGAFPTASGTVDTVSFNLIPAIPPAAAVPVAGEATAVAWNGASPGVTSASTSLPVEVRSNAGQISLFAAVATPLTSGANSIALSEIVLTSSDADLPAPVIPDAGAGPPVNVTGTAFSGLVTMRSADWTFSYNPLLLPPAGVYTGQVRFTASSP